MSFLKQKLIKLAGKLLPEINSSRNAYINALEQIINHRNLSTSAPDADAALTIIVFSKDRAIQLHALLASYFDLVAGEAAIHVLYTASTKEHEKAYDQLKSILPSSNITFRLESNFRNDLIALLDVVTSTKLMFFVDDIIFKEPLDLNEFVKYNTHYFVPTLRMGDHLNYSYTTRKQQPLPVFVKGTNTSSQNLVWRWQDGQLDWAYPLSVDGHLFDTMEIRKIIHSLDFKAPNSLEENMQLFMPIYKTKYGIAMKKSVIMNIPNNKVQQENDNHAGKISTDELLEKWQQGYQINYRKLRHFVNTSAHQEVDLEFIKLEVSN